MTDIKTPASDGQSETQGLENNASVSISQGSVAEFND